MNICHVVQSLEIGGMERVVLTLVKKQREKNLHPYIFCLEKHGDFIASAESMCVCGGTPNKLQNFFDFNKLVQLYKFVQTHKIDLLHAHNQLAMNYASLVSLATKAKSITTFHGHGYFAQKRHILLTRWLCKVNRSIITVSNEVKNTLSVHKISPGWKINNIVNGIEPPPLPCGNVVESLRQENNISHNQLVIGSVGRLSREKNYKLMIDAFYRVLENGIDAALILVGDGIEKHFLENVVKSGPYSDHVHLVGAHDNIEEWLALFDIFSLSSHTEGTSMSLLEAGATGLPAVVTDVGGNGEVVVHDKTGLVVPPGNADGLASAFLRLTEDCELRKSMGTAAREHIQKHYSVDYMVDEYLKVYRQAIT